MKNTTTLSTASRFLARTALAATAGMAFALTSCEQEGPAEKAGENLDEAAEEVGDAADEVSD